MKKEKDITPLSKFPTEVLVFYFKKFRKCRHREYEDEWYNWIVEDKTEAPFEQEDEDGDGYWVTNEMYINFEGMYWRGKRDEFMKELNKREHVNINAKNFKDWKREYKKSLKR